MGIWGLILAFLISQYWGWALLILVILISITNPLIGLCLLVGAILFFLFLYLWEKFELKRNERCREAWAALPETEKQKWEKVSIEIISNFGNYWVRGEEAYWRRFNKYFGIIDAFSKEFKKEIPIPKKSSFWKGISVEK